MQIACVWLSAAVARRAHVQCIAASLCWRQRGRQWLRGSVGARAVLVEGGPWSVQRPCVCVRGGLSRIYVAHIGAGRARPRRRRGQSMRAVGRASTRSRTRQWVRFGLKARPRWRTHARGHLASRAAAWPWRTCSPWRRRVRVTAGCGVTRRRSDGSMHKRIRRGTFGHLQEAQLQEAHRRHKAHAEQ